MPRFDLRIAHALVVPAVLAAICLLTACDQYAVAAGPDVSATPTPELTPVPVSAPSRTDPCTIEGLPAGAAVDPIRDTKGTCVPTDTAVLVRCDPKLAPAIVMDRRGDPRVFLGGPFATPLAGAPPRTVDLGTTIVGRVWQGTADPRRLFVESAGSWGRWLSLAAPERVSPRPTIALVGDSILDGAAQSATEALPGWDVSIDAEVGRASYTAADIVEAMPAPAPDVLVVEIGTNDHDPAAFAENVRRILSATSGVDLLVWVTTHTPDTDSDAINAALVAAVAEAPRSAIADWDRFVSDDELTTDGVHPAPGNEHLLADLLTPLLTRWLDAERGSATDCLPGP